MAAGESLSKVIIRLVASGVNYCLYTNDSFYKFMNDRKLGATMMTALVITIIVIGITPILLQHPAYAVHEDRGMMEKTTITGPLAPIATSGDNVYIAWWHSGFSANFLGKLKYFLISWEYIVY